MFMHGGLPRLLIICLRASFADRSGMSILNSGPREKRNWEARKGPTGHRENSDQDPLDLGRTPRGLRTICSPPRNRLGTRTGPARARKLLLMIVWHSNGSRAG